MIFNTSPDDDEKGLTHRLLSEHGVVEIGIFRVMFGWRVRAGFAENDTCCILDWCGGGNWENVERLYALARSILSSRPEDYHCFDGLPASSLRKPFYNDPSFVSRVFSLAGEFEVEHLAIPRPEEFL